MSMRCFIVFSLFVVLVGGCSTLAPDGTVIRDPGGNAALSYIYPGIGQFCNEDPTEGVLMGGIAAFTFYKIIDANDRDDDSDRALYIALHQVLAIWSAVDAWHYSAKYNSELGPSEKPVASFGLGIDPSGKGVLASLSWDF